MAHPTHAPRPELDRTGRDAKLCRYLEHEIEAKRAELEQPGLNATRTEVLRAEIAFARTLLRPVSGSGLTDDED